MATPEPTVHVLPTPSASVAAEWADEWTLALSGTVTPATTAVYLRALRQFLHYLDQHHPGIRSAEDVTRQHVEGWMASLADQGRSPATRSVRLKSLSRFFEYVESETGHPNPCAKVARVRVEAPLVDVPTDETIRALIAVCETGKGFTDRRDAALIRLLADAGLRREEAVSLNLDDLDLPGRAVLVRQGKGGKTRVVAIGDRTALALSRWLRARKSSPWSTSAAVFLSQRGGRLTGGAVAMMLERRCADAGVPPIHPHQLRHAATHALLAAGVGEQAVEHQMGWTGGAMVRRYGAALAAKRSRDLVAQAKVGDRL